MKLIIAILLIGIFPGIGLYLYPDYARSHMEIIRLNSNSNTNGFPMHFRVTNMNTSGSAQFSEKELVQILQFINKPKIYVVDLRAESHGFLNGDPISWYQSKNWLNKGKTFGEILSDENEKLDALSKKTFSILYRKTGSRPFFYWINEVVSAEDVVLRNGASYVRFPVDDFCRPSDAVVDDFVQFAQSLDVDTWLHFHCSGGKGRTTLFLAMFDMMKHAQTETLNEMIDKQASIGGIHLLNKPGQKPWKEEESRKRALFATNFYAYCREVPDFSVPWSQWIAQRVKSD